jgi:hypothetical protein
MGVQNEYMDTGAAATEICTRFEECWMETGFIDLSQRLHPLLIDL